MCLMKKYLSQVSLGLFIFILWVSGSILAEDKAYFTADKTTPLIGDPVQLILHIRIPAQAKFIPPDFSSLSSPIFVKEVGSLSVVSQTNGETEYQLPLTVVLWGIGQYFTPPLVVSYQVDAASPVNLSVESIQFDVPSVLNENDLSLRPLKPQINLRYFPVWILGVVVAVVIILSAFVVRYRLVRKSSQPPPNTMNNNWHPEANTALNSLRQFGQSGDNPPTIYVQVSDCLRQYLDARFALQASDLTTSELLANLETRQIIVNDQQQKLAEMLKRADLVKFARVIPKLNTAQQYAVIAAQWIQSVEQTQAEQVS